MTRVLWKLHSATMNTASVRYRCIIPVFESLKSQPNDYVHFIESGDQFSELINSVDILVFVKSYYAADVEMMKVALDKGIKVILDICDNVPYSSKDLVIRERFAIMFGMANQVVVPTIVLKEALVQIFGADAANKIVVIPDPLENLKHIQFGKKILNFRRLKNIYLNRDFFAFIKYVGLFFMKGIKVIFKCPYRVYLHICIFIFAKKSIEKNLNLKKLDIRMPFFVKLLLFPYMIFYYILIALSLNKVRIPIGFAYNFLFSVYHEQKLGFSFFFKDLFARKTKNTLYKKYLFDLKEARSPKVSRILWFGNAGQYGLFGVSDLLIIKNELNKLSKDRNIELIIISNNFELFLKVQKDLNISCRYLPWSLTAVYDVLPIVDVTIVPNPLNHYTMTKSSNRSLLSLMGQVPVVSTKTRDLEGFAECILFENWHDSISSYLNDRHLREKHLERAQLLLEESGHNAQNVWRSWNTLLESLTL